MSGDIIVLAAIAIFVLLRLRSVLGQKTGLDQPMEHLQEMLQQKDDRVVQLKPRDDGEESEADDTPEEDVADDVSDAVASIRKLDSSFRLSQFLEGAKMAFDMVMDAYEDDNHDVLQQLLSKDVYKEFSTAMEARDGADEREFVTLVSVGEAHAASVELKRNKAIIEVTFTSEQIRVMKNKDGEVVGGDASKIIQVEDSWVFTRDVKASDPNWVIVET